jgi:hypothetical protein
LIKKTGTDLWTKAIDKETMKTKVAWKTRGDIMTEDCWSGKELIGYTEIECHLIFDLKMDFRRKARFVTGGHMTDAPSSITYSSVVSRISVCLAFLIAALNNLDVMMCDIGNAYLNAPCREKIWFKGGREMGEDKAKVLELKRALYGLKSSGASWRSMLSGTLRDLGFQNTRVDPDVWRRPATKPDDTQYYELLLVYVDDILLASHYPRITLTAIGGVYDIKAGSLGPPNTYLCAQIYKHHLPTWGMPSEKYVKNAVGTVEDLLKNEDGKGNDYQHLKTTVDVPLPKSYRLELDLSKELTAELSSRY